MFSFGHQQQQQQQQTPPRLTVLGEDIIGELQRHSYLRNFDSTLMASMVSLFSLYSTKWQKLPRFLGQKCFLGAFKETQKKEGKKKEKHPHIKKCGRSYLRRSPWPNNVEFCLKLFNKNGKACFDTRASPKLPCVEKNFLPADVFTSIPRRAII